MRPLHAVGLFAVAAFAGCASARPAHRLPPTPLAPAAAVAAEARVRADADRAPAPPGAPSPFVADPAVRVLYGAAWPEPHEPVAAPAADAPPPGWSDPAYAQPAPVAARSRRPFVPVGTVLGAGIGGALSTRSHRAEGALLGAGIGLLFDLQRSSW